MSFEKYMLEMRKSIEQEAIKSGYYRPELDYKRDKPVERVSVFQENKKENETAEGDGFSSQKYNTKEYKDKINRLKKELKNEKIRERREKTEEKRQKEAWKALFSLFK